MKTSMISTVLLGAVANGFLITDCSSGQITNFGDNKCQIWTAGTFSFQSNAGCTLSAYSGGNCQGSIFTTATQNQCQTAPDGVVSIPIDKDDLVSEDPIGIFDIAHRLRYL
ncbi:hypothetical protein M426DRAFT_11616 [Hypoxylon sp. CI-4A]|nr:hypothetical protein M426DRAFT_11616 [Hypoxylon sp. CI-4A]